MTERAIVKQCLAFIYSDYDYSDMPYTHMRLTQGDAKLNKCTNAYNSFIQALVLARQQKREEAIIDALQDMVNAAQLKL